MRVLIACEFSGTVRDAFTALGHDAISCDLLPTDTPGKHYQGDVFDIIGEDWDLMIAFPPCTFLTVTANKWMKPEYADRFPTRPQDRKDAIDFFIKLAGANIPRIAIENPIGIMSTVYRKPNQIIQPFYFGDRERKSTCLWLKNLPKLYYAEKDTLFEAKTWVEPEFVVYNCASNKSGVSKFSKAWQMPPSPDRWKVRSKTFPGIAKAMATQWSVKD